MDNHLKTLNQERLVTLSIALFFLIIFVGSFQYHPMSRLFPLIVSGFGLLISVFYLFRPQNRAQVQGDASVIAGDEPPTARQLIRGILLVVASTISFILLGFWITSVALILIVPRVMGWRANPIVLILIAALTTGSVALLFNVLLKSPMPDGVIVEWASEALTAQD